MHTNASPQPTDTRPAAGAAERAPVSLVCVFNDEAVLDSCLRRSVRDGIHSAPQTELIAVDNRTNDFSSAGAALNDGAHRARNEVVVFVHQDVYLHSLPDLERAAAALLADPGIGVLGAVGMGADDRLVGRMRDRVIPVGLPARTPLPIDSLDEVLFMVRGRDVLDSPLSEHEALSWHAYAVEYSARVRRAGLRATAMDIPLTHNSMTTNLAHLDRAHAHVGALYPELAPLRTTCGTVRDAGRPARLPMIADRVRRLAIWGVESVRAAMLRARMPASTIVLADMRFLVDRAAELGGLDSIRVLDLADGKAATTGVSGLTRGPREFSVATATPGQMREALQARPSTEALLLTNLGLAELVGLGLSAEVPHVVGLSQHGGLWTFVGATPGRLAPLWSRRRNHAFAVLPQRGRTAAVAAAPADGSA